ncbi:unnamed protein product, partial [Mesorhabditis spiculigera]
MEDEAPSLEIMEQQEDAEEEVYDEFSVEDLIQPPEDEIADEPEEAEPEPEEFEAPPPPPAWKPKLKISKVQHPQSKLGHKVQKRTARECFQCGATEGDGKDGPTLRFFRWDDALRVEKILTSGNRNYKDEKLRGFLRDKIHFFICADHLIVGVSQMMQRQQLRHECCICEEKLNTSQKRDVLTRMAARRLDALLGTDGSISRAMSALRDRPDMLARQGRVQICKTHVTAQMRSILKTENAKYDRNLKSFADLDTTCYLCGQENYEGHRVPMRNIMSWTGAQVLDETIEHSEERFFTTMKERGSKNIIICESHFTPETHARLDEVQAKDAERKWQKYQQQELKDNNFRGDQQYKPAMFRKSAPYQISAPTEAGGEVDAPAPAEDGAEGSDDEARKISEALAIFSESFPRKPGPGRPRKELKREEVRVEPNAEEVLRELLEKPDGRRRKRRAQEYEDEQIDDEHEGIHPYMLKKIKPEPVDEDEMRQEDEEEQEQDEEQDQEEKPASDEGKEDWSSILQEIDELTAPAIDHPANPVVSAMRSEAYVQCVKCRKTIETKDKEQMENLMEITRKNANYMEDVLMADGQTTQLLRNMRKWVKYGNSYVCRSHVEEGKRLLDQREAAMVVCCCVCASETPRKHCIHVKTRVQAQRLDQVIGSNMKVSVSFLNHSQYGRHRAKNPTYVCRDHLCTKFDEAAAQRKSTLPAPSGKPYFKQKALQGNNMCQICGFVGSGAERSLVFVDDPAEIRLFDDLFLLNGALCRYNVKNMGTGVGFCRSHITNDIKEEWELWKSARAMLNGSQPVPSPSFHSANLTRPISPLTALVDAAAPKRGRPVGGQKRDLSDVLNAVLQDIDPDQEDDDFPEEQETSPTDQQGRKLGYTIAKPDAPTIIKVTPSRVLTSSSEHSPAEPSTSSPAQPKTPYRSAGGELKQIPSAPRPSDAGQQSADKKPMVMKPGGAAGGTPLSRPIRPVITNVSKPLTPGASGPITGRFMVPKYIGGRVVNTLASPVLTSLPSLASLPSTSKFPPWHPAPFRPPQKLVYPSFVPQRQDTDEDEACEALTVSTGYRWRNSDWEREVNFKPKKTVLSFEEAELADRMIPGAKGIFTRIKQMGKLPIFCHHHVDMTNWRVALASIRFEQDRAVPVPQPKPIVKLIPKPIPKPVIQRPPLPKPVFEGPKPRRGRPPKKKPEQYDYTELLKNIADIKAEPADDE